MSVSVIIRTKDEADRLRLVMTSLMRQSMDAEIVVVNDGSGDHTRAVIEEMSSSLPLVVMHHESARGRPAASNAGARLASGQVLLFLDGDTLADPDFVRHHATLHAAQSDLIGRGETCNLRCTRFLLDPEALIPQPAEAAKIARLSADERAAMMVSRSQILDNFAAISRRAELGVYPGFGPRRLQELEFDALRNHPECTVLWAAASGSNQSMARDAFLSVGGFNEALDLIDHRELALRLCQAGLRMVPVNGAKSYHLTHRSGWRDPLQDTAWERIFFTCHPIASVKLLAVFWASISVRSRMADAERINSLIELEAAARGDTGVDYDRVRAHLGLPDLRTSPSRDGAE